MEEKIITPAEEEKPATDETVETLEAPDKKPEEQPEVSVGEMVEKPEEKRDNLIPESVFLGEKKARKALEKEVKLLKEMIESGGTKEEISDDIATIAEEHNIDREFLQKLASSIKKDTEKELDEKYSSKFEKREIAEKFDTAFLKAWGVSMERAPEFVEIANIEVIKSLSLLPKNSKKTISNILEETYGNALTGKRTIDTTIPGGGKDPEPLDFARAGKDIEYFKQVMSDTKMKNQYNDAMLKRGF